MHTFIRLLLVGSLGLFLVSCGGDTSEQQTDVQVDSVAEQPTEQQTEQATTEETSQQAAQQTTPPSGGQSGQTTTPKPKAPVFVVMPESTAVAVTLVDSIDTDTHLSGQQFRATLSQAIMVDGRTLFDVGSPVMGVLDSVVESGRLKTPAELHFHVSAIQDSKGNWVDVPTDLIVEKMGSHTDREVAMIGGGAIVGGIIGKVIDKKGSTEIGAAAGAVVGTGVAAATGKKDIFYGVGSEIVFFSREPIRIEIK